MSEPEVLDQQAVTTLKGVGPKVAGRLARLGIHSVQDILFHLPLRYQDRTRVSAIGSLRPGQQVVIEAEINLAEIRFGRRRSLLVHVSDGTGSMILRFFHFSAAQKNNLQKGRRLRCFGEVRNGPNRYEMVHPEYQSLEQQPVALEDSLTPVYPTTDGLHQLSWRELIRQSMERLNTDTISDYLPDELLAQFAFPDLKSCLNFLHYPPTGVNLDELSEAEHPAQQRLIFEELLAHQISLRLLRQTEQQKPAHAMPSVPGLVERFLDSLGFALTSAQRRVFAEISQDLALQQPMMRLVQGDVGSGKTVVAALAVIQTLAAGHQAVLMVPTELLSEQHDRSFREWLEPMGIRVGWLTGKLGVKRKRELLAGIASGECQLIVGTHALLQDTVEYHSPGLVIIDEQHRFGVHQRLMLREKGRHGRVPHQLVMTATPIPRTLAMSAFADLDVSVIDELPPGRTPVKTVVISDARREEVIERVRQACQQGRQAYWVCTLIEESESLQCQAAEETATQLSALFLGLRVGLVHGRLKADEKEVVMQAFKQGELDLLVATTVIEVGVNVPNASLMVIENPERLGLSQLHQLRGRVGRGSTESHCVLMYHPPLGQNGQQRLQVMRETGDGFLIAEKDLELRGPGEVLGTRQTGEVQMRIADLLRDEHWLPEVRQAADWLIEQYPDRARQLVQRWLGERVNYASV